ncbi:hypothetical protein SAMN04487897_10983 [Paenibacillus sp. yr247]|uniref:hypothetical protein n=1 Tax=Paenibacillus sp. yr247 TaxID=1761880 RepID=UPI000890A880|nr:hypothetical protein [Paenibacillus sp. yr247]SDO16922.1 hypothetical protein SAMN04487897_10983 [Paenibacillus sp. yr247]
MPVASFPMKVKLLTQDEINANRKKHQKNMLREMDQNLSALKKALVELEKKSS